MNNQYSKEEMNTPYYKEEMDTPYMGRKWTTSENEQDSADGLDMLLQQLESEDTKRLPKFLLCDQVRRNKNRCL